MQQYLVLSQFSIVQWTKHFLIEVPVTALCLEYFSLLIQRYKTLRNWEAESAPAPASVLHQTPKPDSDSDSGGVGVDVGVTLVQRSSVFTSI